MNRLLLATYSTVLMAQLAVPMPVMALPILDTVTVKPDVFTTTIVEGKGREDIFGTVTNNSGQPIKIRAIDGFKLYDSGDFDDKLDIANVNGFIVPNGCASDNKPTYPQLANGASCRIQFFLGTLSDGTIDEKVGVWNATAIVTIQPDVNNDDFQLWREAKPTALQVRIVGSIPEPSVAALLVAAALVLAVPTALKRRS